MLPYILGAIAGFLLGIFPGLVLGLKLRDIRDKLIAISKRLSELDTSPKQMTTAKKDKMLFAEPMDPLQFAAMEQQEQIRKLNE